MMKRKNLATVAADDQNGPGFWEFTIETSYPFDDSRQIGDTS